MKNLNKNVLLVGDEPYSPFGGISSHMRDFARELKKQGYKVFFLAPSKKQEVVEKEGLKIYRWRARKNLHKIVNPKNIILNTRAFWLLRKYKLSIKKILREIIFIDIIKNVLENNNIKLVSFYEIAGGYSIPVLRKVLKLNLPIVLTMFADIYENFSYLQSRSELVGAILDMSDQVVASTKYAARSMELLGLDSSGIKVIYYGVDLSRFSPKVDGDKIRNTFKVPSGSKILLFLGRMEKEMGLDVILEVVPKILAQRDDVVFFIIGAKGELTEQACALGEKFKNKVFVKVNVPFYDLPYYYASCDALLAPSRGKHASMGMSIKEAMASGRPIVATNAPGIAEAVIDSQTGFLVQTDKDLVVKNEALYKTVLNCLSSFSQLKLMGANARKRAEELFSKDITSKKMLAIFKSLLNNNVRN